MPSINERNPIFNYIFTGRIILTSIPINKYKKVEYVAEEYPTPLEIMKDLNELEMQITAGLAELEEML